MVSKDKFVIIEHVDDKFGSTFVLGVADTHEEAVEFILHDYFNGDKEQMDYEYQGDDYWSENCYGVEIVVPKQS